MLLKSSSSNFILTSTILRPESFSKPYCDDWLSSSSFSSKSSSLANNNNSVLVTFVSRVLISIISLSISSTLASSVSDNLSFISMAASFSVVISIIVLLLQSHSLFSSATSDTSTFIWFSNSIVFSIIVFSYSNLSSCKCLFSFWSVLIDVLNSSLLEKASALFCNSILYCCDFSSTTIFKPSISTRRSRIILCQYCLHQLYLIIHRRWPSSIFSQTIA